MSTRPVLIMAGGTGGHVFPALALARLLRERSFEVVWLGTRRGLEARIVPSERIPIEWLSIGGLRGKGALTLLVAPFKLALALWQALSVMRRHRPVVVVGLGGFVTGPGGGAAWLTRRRSGAHDRQSCARRHLGGRASGDALCRKDGGDSAAGAGRQSRRNALEYGRAFFARASFGLTRL